MTNEYANKLYIVTATKGSITEQWVAATNPKEALIAVQLQAGPEWRVTVTDQTITSSEARKLSLRPRDVRRLKV